METGTIIAPTSAPATTGAPTRSVPWYCRTVVLGATSIVVGVLWDISWHRTIGRDTFWTPAHMAIYFGGVLGGLTCGWLAFRTTFLDGAAARQGTVACWGARAPLGAWVIIWGALAMLISAPFDDWWHNAYGLDVQIISPPHTVLAAGMYGVALGAMLLVLRHQNLSGAVPAPGRWSLAYTGGVLVAMVATMLTEYSFPNQQHTGRFYIVSCAVYPVILNGIGRATRLCWAATAIALAYMGIVAGMGWILPLFPGQPLLGPIYHPVDHMVPLPFPLLLAIPAIGIDTLHHRCSARNDWLLAVLSGAGFFVVFLVVQWFFSAFLISPAADNWFFAGNKWEYGTHIGEWCHRFWDETFPRWNPPTTVAQLETALFLAMASSRIGLALGKWMSKVRR